MLISSKTLDSRLPLLPPMSRLCLMQCPGCVRLLPIDSLLWARPAYSCPGTRSSKREIFQARDMPQEYEASGVRGVSRVLLVIGVNYA
eukprot:scaffold171504_cov37-Prasinocladus_malaysianus.AAC.1